MTPNYKHIIILLRLNLTSEPAVVTNLFTPPIYAQDIHDTLGMNLHTLPQRYHVYLYKDHTGTSLFVINCCNSKFKGYYIIQVSGTLFGATYGAI